MQRHISEQGLALIRHFEGFQPRPYACPGGYQTIGYGHVLQAGEDYPADLTLRQAEALLREDAARASAAVDHLLPVALSPGQFDALASFVFNLGAGALQRSTLRQRVRRGEHEAAAREFLRWIYAGGKPLKGLLRRRLAEARLYETGSWP
jgi:lysozyme